MKKMIKHPRAFAVLFKDLNLWSVGSFFKINWQWPPEYIKPLSTALIPRQEVIDRKKHSFEKLQLITLHFNGVIEQRELNGQEEFKGKLYFAYADDVVFSKIDVRNGAIGVVPASMPCIAVSSEYPIYEVIQNVALPRYIQLLFKTAYFRQAINSMISGASGRKRVQPTQILDLAVPLPPKDTQQAIVALWQKVQEEAEASQNLLQNLSDNLNTILYSRYNLSNKDDALKSRSIGVNWKDVTAWDVKNARAAKFRIANPSFVPLKEFIEEATELVRPWEEPDKEWPI